jgi:hypothetical protein
MGFNSEQIEVVLKLDQRPRFARRQYQIARRAALGLSLLLPLPAQADDWPQWHGLNRDGVWNADYPTA